MKSRIPFSRNGAKSTPKTRPLSPPPRQKTKKKKEKEKEKILDPTRRGKSNDTIQLF